MEPAGVAVVCLAGLDEVAWADLSHGYGPASDVPGLLRDLASDVLGRADRGYRRLADVLSNGEDGCDAVAPTVPYLWELAATRGVRRRDRLLRLLHQLGGGELRWRDFVAASAREPDSDVWRWAVPARRAVADGTVPHAWLLTDPDPGVRAATAHLFSGFAERAGELVPVLLARLPVEDVPRVRVHLMLAAALLAQQSRPAGPAVVAALVPLLDDPDPGVSVAAAVGIRWQTGDRPVGSVTGRVPAILLGALGRPLPALSRSPFAEQTRDLVGAALGGATQVIRQGLTASAALTRRSVVALAAGRMARDRNSRTRLVPLLAPALADRAPLVRVAAARAVAYQGGHARGGAADALADALTRAMRHERLDPFAGTRPVPDVWLADAGLYGLSQLGDPRCVPHLARVLAEWRAVVRWEPVLAGIAPYADRLLPAARTAVRDPCLPDVPPRLRARDTGAAALLAGVAAWGHQAADLAEDLLALLDHDRLQLDAVRALGAVTPPTHPLAVPVTAALSALLDALDTASWPWPPTVVLAYWRVSRDDDTAVRMLLGYLRAGTGWGYTLPALAELGPAAAAAAPTIGRLLSDPVLPGGASIQAAYAWWRITADPLPALPALLATLRTEPTNRLALTCVAEIGSPAATAVPILRRLRDRNGPLLPHSSVDSSEAIRRLAVDALRAIGQPS